jgi:hypothetical protein
MSVKEKHEAAVPPAPSTSDGLDTLVDLASPQAEAPVAASEPAQREAKASDSSFKFFLVSHVSLI